MVLDFFRKVYLIFKKDCNPKGKLITLIGHNLNDEKEILTRLGFAVNILDPKEDIREKCLLSDFVFYQGEGYIPIEREKDVNAALGIVSPFTECYSLGIISYLTYKDFELTGKNILIYGSEDYRMRRLADKLDAAGATVTLLNRQSKYAIRPADLIIYKGDKTFNCYPVHCPVLDLSKKCINIDNRDVEVGDRWFTIIGLLEQLW